MVVWVVVVEEVIVWVGEEGGAERESSKGEGTGKKRGR